MTREGPIKALKDHIKMIEASLRALDERMKRDSDFKRDLVDQLTGCQEAIRILQGEKSVAASDSVS